MDELKSEIVDGLISSMEGVVSGAEEDLRQFATEISEDMIKMIDTGNIDPDLLNEWGHQFQLVGEATRLSATAEAYAQMARIATLVVRAAIAAAMA